MTVINRISKIIEDYVIYAEKELRHSEQAYHSQEGEVVRSSVLRCRRGNIIVEVAINVKCYQAPEEEI